MNRLKQFAAPVHRNGRGKAHGTNGHASPAVPADSVAKAARAFSVAGIRAALSGGTPGNWASDHRTETEKFTGWHYVAIRAIATQAAQASAFVYQDGLDGSGGGNSMPAWKSRARRKTIRAARLTGLEKSYGYEQATDPLPETHPLVRLLKRPNPWQSGASFRYEQILQLCLTGSCLIWKRPNQRGLTVERYVIPTAVAIPLRPTRDLPRGGYRIDPCSARNPAFYDAQGFSELQGWGQFLNAVLPAEQMMIVRDPHPLYKDDGQSPVSAGAMWSDIADMLDRSRWASMKNGPDPSLVVALPADVSPGQGELEAMASLFNAKYAGVDNTGRAIFTTGGAEVTRLTTSPREMAYELSFTQMRDCILALHGVTPIAAGMLDGGSFAAFVAALRQFVLLTVQPRLSLLAEEETEQQAPEFGDGLTVEYEAVSVDDPAQVEAMLATDIAAQARTKDEHRAERGLPPLPNGEGLAMVGATAAGAPVAGQSAVGSLDLTDAADGSDPFAEISDGGELASFGRRQGKTNLKATREVLDEVSAGTIGDVLALETLVGLGWKQDRAQRLIDDAKDGQVDDPEVAANHVAPAKSARVSAADTWLEKSVLAAERAAFDRRAASA